jgi:hypothetical protein
MKPLSLLVLILLLALPSLSTAQVVARQGTPAEPPPQEFKSPMVLDLPIKDFQVLASGNGKDFKEVRRYYCEDVTLSELLVTKKEESHRGKAPGMKLKIRGSVSVRPSHDRLATLRFDVLKNEERFATAQVSEINAEEGKTHGFSTSLELDAEALERLFAAGEPPLLRVTVTVQDNN